MTLSCDIVRERLADGAIDDEVRVHVGGCESCRSLLEALREVDDTLGELAPIDASDELVARTLARVSREASDADDTAIAPEAQASRAQFAPPPPSSSAEPTPRAPVEVGAGSLLGAAGSTIVAALVAVLTLPVVLVRAVRGWFTSRASTPQSSTPQVSTAPTSAPATESSATSTHDALPQAARRDAARRDATRRPERGWWPRRYWAEATMLATLTALIAVVGWQRFGQTVKGKIDGSTNTLDAMPTDWGGASGSYEAPSAYASSPVAPPAEPRLESPALGGQGQGSTGRRAERSSVRVDPVEVDMPARAPAEGVLAGRVALDEENGVENDRAQWHRATDEGRFEALRGERVRELEGGRVAEHAAQRILDGQRNEEDEDGRDRGIEASVVEVDGAFASLVQTTGLALRSRDGWWLNTYVPGDPAMRLVEARLASSTTTLPGLGVSSLGFADAITPNAPLLEAPTDHALGLGVLADVASVEGPTRVHVEVALRAIASSSGRRGVLRVAVVLDDASSLDPSAAARARALVMALAEASSARDRIALYASGQRGGCWAELGPMSTGRLEVGLRRSLADTGVAAPSRSLREVVADALEAVAGNDGVGLVLLVTASDVREVGVEEAVGLGALAGVTTSAVAIGSTASRDGLDAIARAGQGRRRFLLDEEGARTTARAEIAAASELVARALRVRIRLAEGVELVDVLGSRPLDAEESRRTREAEQAIDRDLMRRLGILADRDEDDDGVRMLLPSFYAGDTHTIMLDLLVNRPGAVLDVDVALKDLVRVGNARASASLSLPSGRASRGPRELRVLADVLAHETASALAESSDALAHGERLAASSRLQAQQTLLLAAASSTPGLDAMPSFVRDRRIVADALTAMSTGDTATLSDAFALAAHRRLMRPRFAERE